MIELSNSYNVDSSVSLIWHEDSDELNRRWTRDRMNLCVSIEQDANAALLIWCMIQHSIEILMQNLADVNGG